jgi:Protein of unknown function (DUF3455)
VAPAIVGVGTQNYICLPTGDDTFAFTLFTPEATLFDGSNEQLTTHFFGPNPDEKGTIRVAWEDSRDTSTVWAAWVAPSTDPAFVDPHAIPWLLLRKVGDQDGPTGGRTLSVTTFIQRVNSVGHFGRTGRDDRPVLPSGARRPALRVRSRQAGPQPQAAVSCRAASGNPYLLTALRAFTCPWP